jgi:hypothetical protein
MPNFPAVPEFPRPSSSSRKAKDDNCCSRTERCCCAVATWLPISIVYGATAWAIYVNGYLIGISFISGFLGIYSLLPSHLQPVASQIVSFMLLELGIFGVKLMAGWFLAALALILYALCIWSYSIAVFTNPLSPIDAVPTPHTSPNNISTFISQLLPISAFLPPFSSPFFLVTPPVTHNRTTATPTSPNTPPPPTPPCNPT